MGMTEERVVSDYWLRYYAKGPSGCCTLCGNTGWVDTTGRAMDGSRDCGKRQPCFCPNGQEERKDLEKSR